MSELFVGLDTVRVYIDDLLHVTKVSCTEHITVLEVIFTRLKKAEIKVNARKSCFGAHKSDYLGYHVTHDGSNAHTKKIRGHSSHHSFKNLQTIEKVCRYDQLIQ